MAAGAGVGPVGGDGLKVRSARASDSDSVADLLAQLGYNVAPGDVPDRLSAIASASGEVLVAVDSSGRALGLVGVQAFPVIHAPARAGYLTALVVREDARGRGVGRTLVRAAEEWARSAGCGRLTVTSAEHRDDAHAFYPSVGLAYTGRRYARSLSGPSVK